MSIRCHRVAVAVVSRGQIVEKGTYDELVALGGLFHGLATKQLKVAVEVVTVAGPEPSASRSWRETSDDLDV